MGVYRRLREETDFDTLELCNKLKRLTTKYVMNEKRVPKRWRFIFATKLIDYADKIRENVTIANDIKATDIGLLAERYKYQTRAISFCNLYQDELLDMEETLDGVTEENLKEIVDIFDSLLGHILNWRKKDRVISC